MEGRDGWEGVTLPGVLGGGEHRETPALLQAQQEYLGDTQTPPAQPPENSCSGKGCAEATLAPSKPGDSSIYGWRGHSG